MLENKQMKTWNIVVKKEEKKVINFLIDILKKYIKFEGQQWKIF